MEYKTRSQLKLEALESLDRPLSDAESDELRRALHAVEMNGWRKRRLDGFRKVELELLAKVEAESRLRSDLA